MEMVVKKTDQEKGKIEKDATAMKDAAEEAMVSTIAPTILCYI